MRINHFTGKRILVPLGLAAIISLPTCNRDRELQNLSNETDNIDSLLYSVAKDLLHAHALKDNGYATLIEGDALLQARDTTEAQNRWREALRYFDESINIEYRDINSIKGRAYALQRLGNLEEALFEYQHAVAMAETLGVANNRDIAPLYNDLGTLYTELKQYDKAREFYQRALSIDPEYQTPKRNLALLDQKGY